MTPLQEAIHAAETRNRAQMNADLDVVRDRYAKLLCAEWDIIGQRFGLRPMEHKVTQ